MALLASMNFLTSLINISETFDYTSVKELLLQYKNVQQIFKLF